jgi:hypothetical protein
MYRDESARPAGTGLPLAILTDTGWAKVTTTAPSHVAEVRRRIFDPLTKTQQRQLRDIGRRLVRAIDPDDPCLDEQPLGAANHRVRTSTSET